MSTPDPVGANRSPSDSSCGDADKSNSICCVDGREPEVNEVWILGYDRLTPEVNPTAQVDVNGCEIATNYLTENGFNSSIFFKKPSI